MKFMMVCGGSAGHINPAIATADALRRALPGCGILFVGAGRSMEKKLVPQAGYELRNLDMLGLSRGLSPKKLMQNTEAAFKLATAARRADKLIREFQPDVVIGTGGYICYPVLKAAAKATIPTVLHESNAVPGLTTKLLTPIADKIFVSFEESIVLYKDSEKVSVMATPVRANFMRYTRERARHDLALDDETHVVVSFWGSLGASGMNEIMKGFITQNIKEGAFHHIHAVGTQEGATELIRDVSGGEKLPEYVNIKAYIDDMPCVMAAADLVLCRAGGSTLAELSALGRAAVLVPSPYVANDHQTPNAAAMAAGGGATVVSEADCTGEELFKTVADILHDKSGLRDMEERQRALGARDAAARFAEEIVALM